MTENEARRGAEREPIAGFAMLEKLTFLSGKGTPQLAQWDTFELLPGQGIVFLGENPTVVPLGEAVEVLKNNFSNPKLEIAALMSNVTGELTFRDRQLDVLGTVGPRTIGKKAGAVSAGMSVLQYSWGKTREQAQQAAKIGELKVLKVSLN